ncbi:hypothetical protein L5515_017285 [Caenorhabditis briggsae]|uniref:Uncharacterized protein n=1 Tax=Caenorhabditis briggsae TaxID=6238 RepID=A0AAE9JQM8_CAEBR|nr:hypothetical protein L5515_017285 [Caenorhabditis briggsae]
MEALLEEDVSPNQTMCLEMARQTSEYHKELGKKVRSNFEHMRNANRRLQMSLEELEVEKENMDVELGRRGQRIQELEKSIELKVQNEEKFRSENAEICKKFWDQTAQVDTLIKMLEDKTVRIIGDGMVIQEQQRYIQNLEDVVDCRGIYYVEMPENFQFTKGKWTLRKNATRSIGRMHFVSPRDQKRFALRVMLLNVTDTKSYEDLQTVGGVFYEKFVDAAKAAGYLTEDIFYEKSLEEAASFHSAP